LHEQDTRRPPVVAGQREGAQPLAQAPFGQWVGTAERRVQQGDRRVLVEPVGVEGAAQEQQQRRDRGLDVQRQVFGLGEGGYPGEVQCPLQRRELAGRG